MKKSRYIELSLMRHNGGDPKGIPGINGMDKPAGSKLARRVTRAGIGRRVGVASKAYEQIAKDKRRA